MKLTVVNVHVPPMSTLGYGIGTDETGKRIHFAGDHRPMRDLAEAANYAWKHNQELLTIEIEAWQILIDKENVA